MKARVGYERIEETEDPEKAIQRALATYLKDEFAILTDDISFAVISKINFQKTQEQKKIKGK